MRKYLLIIITIILAILFICLVSFGFLRIKSYSQIASLSEQKNNILRELDDLNSVDFKNKVSELKAATNNYRAIKSQYNSLVESGELSEVAIYNSMDVYNMDFLWTTIGNYATEKGVTLQFDVTRSSTENSISPECVMCDLNFIITGSYISITDFIYSIEDDDKLNFEIEDFLLEKGGEDLQATFVVRGVPINSQNLSSVPVSSSVFDGE